MRITHLYADGGVIQQNPSTIGGTWAWCHVDAAGDRVACASGVITPQAAGLRAISNNLTELLAVVHGLEALPDGWAGVVCSDSQVTLGRIFDDWTMKGVPSWLCTRLHVAQERLRLSDGMLLGGHPTKADLLNGVSKRGYPVSLHNVWCDEACGAAGRRFLLIPS